jgi:hypothetical protein
VGKTDGSSWKSLWGVDIGELKGGDDFGGGFAFEGYDGDFGGWVILWVLAMGLLG